MKGRFLVALFLYLAFASVLRLQNCRYRRRTNGSSCCLAGIDIRQLQDCIGRDLYPFVPTAPKNFVRSRSQVAIL